MLVQTLYQQASFGILQRRSEPRVPPAPPTHNLAPWNPGWENQGENWGATGQFHVESRDVTQIRPQVLVEGIPPHTLPMDKGLKDGV